MTTRVLILGAGIGGLSTAAVLSKQGLDVTVLEAHVYPGGSAGTFYHQGYKFDAGATLAGGFYDGGPMDVLARVAGIESWPLLSNKLDDQPKMTVHLPNGSSVDRWSDERRWEQRLTAFGQKSENFWLWQEQTADNLWNLALRIPEWPANSVYQALRLTNTGIRWLLDSPSRINPNIILDAFRPISVHLSGQSQQLKDFVDAQLLISAQATSEKVYSLYGASALDFPKRGIRHIKGGIGSIAETLVNTIRKNGGRVVYRKEITKIEQLSNSQISLVSKHGERFFGDMLVVNLPRENIVALMNPDADPANIRSPDQGWGAFMIYAGIKSSDIDERASLHHQVLSRRPFAEGNSLFLSISPADDPSRAPQNFRAITISTHTDLRPWWKLFLNDRNAYEARKEKYTRKILSNAERVIPQISSASLLLPGTPVTFQRFTRRAWGWVGGVPQTSIWQSPHPKISPVIWMVGDSVFPGQSIPAVALGGIRVANEVMENLASPEKRGATHSIAFERLYHRAHGD